MLCFRCLRPAFTAARSAPAAWRQTLPSRLAQPQQQRTLTLLSSPRPSLPAARPAPASGSSAADTPTSSFQPMPSGLAQFQARGAKRNTFNPSHVVRKRRHGFLSRVKTRTGRRVLKRRQLRGRGTLSH